MIGMVRSFPLIDQVPDVLRDVILDIQWDLDKLHWLPGLRELAVPVRDLAWHLEVPFWAFDGVPFQLSPRAVVDAPDRHRAQWDRTLAADLGFPVHARVDSAGRLVILDGIHRLLKATVVGQDLILVRVVSDEDLHAIAI
jgi:hypothetical protein